MTQRLIQKHCHIRKNLYMGRFFHVRLCGFTVTEPSWFKSRVQDKQVHVRKCYKACPVNSVQSRPLNIDNFHHIGGRGGGGGDNISLKRLLKSHDLTELPRPGL